MADTNLDEMIRALDDERLVELIANMSLDEFQTLAANLETDTLIHMQHAMDQAASSILGNDDEEEEDPNVAEHAEALSRRLDQEGIKYHRLRKNLFVISYDVEGGDIDVQVYVESHSGYHMRTNDLASYKPANRPKMLEAIDEANGRFRFVKFCTDDDFTVHGEIDVPSVGANDHGNLAVLVQSLDIMVRVCKEARSMFQGM